MILLTERQSVTQEVAISITIALIVLPVIWMMHSAAVLDKSLVVTFVIPTVVLFIGIFSIMWSFSPNYYNISSGVVVEHTFTAAHTSYVLVGKVLVPTRHDDTWTITVYDEATGRKGSFSYESAEAFKNYPVGSRYP